MIYTFRPALRVQYRFGRQQNTKEVAIIKESLQPCLIIAIGKIRRDPKILKAPGGFDVSRRQYACPESKQAARPGDIRIANAKTYLYSDRVECNPFVTT